MIKFRVKQYSGLVLLAAIVVLFGYHFKTILVNSITFSENRITFSGFTIARDTSLLFGCVSIILFVISMGMEWYNKTNEEMLKERNEEIKPEYAKGGINKLLVHKIKSGSFWIMDVSCIGSLITGLSGDVISIQEKGNIGTKGNPINYIIFAAQLLYLFTIIRNFAKKRKDEENDLRYKIKKLKNEKDITP